jgi:hypothetical protein
MWRWCSSSSSARLPHAKQLIRERVSAISDPPYDANQLRMTPGNRGTEWVVTARERVEIERLPGYVWVRRRRRAAVVGAHQPSPPEHSGQTRWGIPLPGFVSISSRAPHEGQNCPIAHL